MFKSIFVKYLTAFMLIIIVSIIISTTVITTLVNLYDGNNKNRILENVTEGTVDYIGRELKRKPYDDFSDYIGENGDRVVTFLGAMSANLDDIVIFIADENGQIILAGGSSYASDYADENGRITDSALVLPDTLKDNLFTGETVKRNDNLDGFFAEKQRTYSTSILSDDGKTICSVMTSTMKNDMDDLLEAMIKTIVMSTLWLMLAALIAVYFITEKLVSPLRAMSKAAKEFAVGHFDARVPRERGRLDVRDPQGRLRGPLLHAEGVPRRGPLELAGRTGRGDPAGSAEGTVLGRQFGGVQRPHAEVDRHGF